MRHHDNRKTQTNAELSYPLERQQSELCTLHETIAVWLGQGLTASPAPGTHDCIRERRESLAVPQSAREASGTIGLLVSKWGRWTRCCPSMNICSAADLPIPPSRYSPVAATCPDTNIQDGIFMARNRSVQEDLDQFLNRETLTLSVNGALQRNRTYRTGIGEDRKGAFRKSLRQCLGSRFEQYRAGRVSEDRHVANIEALSSELSERHQEILVDGRFRIGAAQKALNLYLKYGWARRMIREPPHCPIDSIVLENIEKCPRRARCQICSDTTWTTICTTQEYLHFVEKAREAANVQGLSLARWELIIWEEGTWSA